MTTSVIDFAKIKKDLPPHLAAMIPAEAEIEAPKNKVTIQVLMDRAKALFTPEEAEDLARRIEEGRAHRHD
jgi:hypothetical protein